MFVAWDFHAESFFGGGGVLYLCLYLGTGFFSPPSAEPLTSASGQTVKVAWFWYRPHPDWFGTSGLLRRVELTSNEWRITNGARMEGREGGASLEHLELSQNGILD